MPPRAWRLHIHLKILHRCPNRRLRQSQLRLSRLRLSRLRVRLNSRACAASSAQTRRTRRPKTSQSSVSSAPLPPPHKTKPLTLAIISFPCRYGKGFIKSTKDKTQPRPSLTWVLTDHGLLRADVRADTPGEKGEKYGAKIINAPNPVDNLYKVWKHLLPSKWLERLAATRDGAALVFARGRSVFIAHEAVFVYGTARF